MSTRPGPKDLHTYRDPGPPIKGNDAMRSSMIADASLRLIERQLATGQVASWVKRAEWLQRHGVAA